MHFHAFIGHTAYVLVTLVDVGGNTVGIYRVDGPNTFTMIVDIGAFALQNPPTPAFTVPTFSTHSQVYRDGFLVTDGITTAYCMYHSTVKSPSS